MGATLAAVWPRPFGSDRALRTAAAFWWTVAVIGQAAFVVYIVGFYGLAAAHGRFLRWNDVLVGGWVRGGWFGNLLLAGHLLMAALITASGPAQLVPRLRAAAPAFHRWNGRLYLATAIAAAVAGVWMVWTRGTAGGPVLKVGITVNAALLLACVALAWRNAAARRFAAHRRWALRAFLLVSGVWTFRVGLMAWMLLNHGPVGVGPNFDGPFVRAWAFGCYLLPLAVLEGYLRVQDRGGPAAKALAASGLVLLTLLMGLGIAGAVGGMWAPRIGSA